jgi:hypothetical protein
MLGFQRQLKRRRVAWPQAFEVTSAELVARHVEHGEGAGVGNLAIPSIRMMPRGCAWAQD